VRRRVSRGAHSCIVDGAFPLVTPFPRAAGAPPEENLMPGLACVSEADLRAFLLGKLPEPATRAVAAHLETCPDCEAAARRLDALTDPLIRGLRRVLARDTPTNRATAPAAGAAPLPDLPGAEGRPSRVAGYEILGEVGRGGMSVVYKARQTHPARTVALKMILAGAHAGAERRARFLAEADAIARLRHPHIVQVYEVGEHDGLPFLSLEYVGGGSLAQQTAGVPQPPHAAAALLETVARAVHYAHAHGVVHRDLKPGNILLQNDAAMPSGMTNDGMTNDERSPNDEARSPKQEGGRGASSLGLRHSFVIRHSSLGIPESFVIPKITDFGLAKMEPACLTATGAVLGTPGYMAPEQAAGASRSVGPAADVYALGAILYELLVGGPPFRGATPLDTLEQARSQDPVPPSQSQARTPHDLETICLKCLQKEPAQRYASALELADDLRCFLDGKPIRARPVRAAERAWRWARRNPRVAALAGSVAILLVAVAVVSTAAAVVTRHQLRATQHAEAEATRRLYASLLDQARATRLTGQVGQRHESLATLAEAARLARGLRLEAGERLALRRDAIAALALPDLRVLRDWPAETPLGHYLAFDARLERYAHCDAAGDFLVREVADPEKVLRLPGPGRVPREAYFHFSPDGRFLVVGQFLGQNPHQVVLWDLQAPPAPRPVPLPAGASFLAFRPDSRELALTAADGALCVFDLERRQARAVAPALRAEHAAYGPDGRQLAFSRERQLRLVDLETGKNLHTFAHPAETHLVAWGGDGRLVAVACDDRRIYVWDTVRAGAQAVLEGHLSSLDTLLFNPAGDLLASGNADGTARLWDAVSGLPLVRAPGWPLGFSPDGRRLAFQNHSRAGIWEVADRRECRPWHLGRIGNRTFWLGLMNSDGVAFSPDARLLASGGGGGVRLYDVAAGAEVLHLSGPRHAQVCFTPDGTRLLTYGKKGLRAWPIQPDPAGPPGSLLLGPPRDLDVPVNQPWLTAGFSRDGRWAAVPDAAHQGVLLLDTERPAGPKFFAGCPSLLSLAVSPDGRWLAAGLDRDPTGIKVWDTASGPPVRAPDGTWDEQRAHVAFSPDGRWLASGGERDYRLWKVGSWEAGPVLPRDRPSVWFGPIAFSPDGCLLALARSLTDIELYDLQTGQEVATLTAAEPHHLVWLSFSPDGSRLAAATGTSLAQLWDLRALRAGLRELDLDWDLPPYPPAADADGPRPPLRVTVLPNPESKAPPAPTAQR
jgi:eukaryotic-like serine/threonine-protein kinase